MLGFIKNLSPKELLVLAVIVMIIIIFFGSKAVKGLGRTSGETLREIKSIKKNFKEAVDDDGSGKRGVSA